MWVCSSAKGGGRNVLDAYVARYRDSSKDVLKLGFPMPPSDKLHAVTAHALLEAFTRGTPVKVVEGAVGEVLADYLAT